MSQIVVAGLVLSKAYARPLSIIAWLLALALPGLERRQTRACLHPQMAFLLSHKDGFMEFRAHTKPEKDPSPILLTHRLQR